MYNIVADLHTHTLASTHAYCTLTEMVDAARDKGLYAIAITDHAQSMPGSPRWGYFRALNSVPLMFHGVKCIAGIEANVLDFDGNLDLDPKDYENLDWVIASIHNIKGLDLKDPDIEKTTRLWLNVAENPAVNVIGHSGSPRFAYDIDKVIPVFGKNHKLVEINAQSFESRTENICNCKRIAEACKKYEVPIVVDSDAHFMTSVGNFTKALEMLESIDFPEELIVNSSVERLNEYLDKYTKINTNRKF